MFFLLILLYMQTNTHQHCTHLRPITILTLSSHFQNSVQNPLSPSKPSPPSAHGYPTFTTRQFINPSLDQFSDFIKLFNTHNCI